MSESEWFKKNWADYNYPPDFQYCPLSEERVVRLLITSRSKVDRTHEMMIYAMTEDGFQTQGTPSINEDILCTYYDLDKLIQECGMSDYQKWIVSELMKGHSMTDIQEMTFKRRGDIRAEFDSAVSRIVYQNNENWKKVRVKK